RPLIAALRKMTPNPSGASRFVGDLLDRYRKQPYPVVHHQLATCIDGRHPLARLELVHADGDLVLTGLDPLERDDVVVPNRFGRVPPGRWVAATHWQSVVLGDDGVGRCDKV